jgi:arylsulfatase A-like enzyme
MRAFVQRWRDSATELAVLLCVVHLPLALLFSFRARLFYQTAWDLAKDSCLLLVIYCAVALTVGFLVALIGTLIASFSARRAEQFMALVLFAYVSTIVLSMQPFAQKWWWQMLAVISRARGQPTYFEIVPYVLALFLLLLVVYTWRRGLAPTAQRISTSLHNGLPLTLALLVVCLGVAAFTGHAHWRGFGWQHPLPAQPPAAQKLPNIVLLTIDTLAAGDMSLHGFTHPTTPRIDEYAKGAYVFDNFLANANYTTPTVTSMLTGRYPTAHTVYHHYAGVRPEDRAFNLATILRERGYVTAAIVSNPMAHPRNIGVSQSFDYVSEVLNHEPGHRIGFRVFGFARADLGAFLWDWWLGPAVREIIPRVPLRSLQTRPWFPPRLVIDEAREVLAAGHKPIFLWVHVFAPHEPYLSPEPYMGSLLPRGTADTLHDLMVRDPIAGLFDSRRQGRVDQMRLRYDENIMWVDQEVGAFLAELDESGVTRDGVVMITADHGESFEKNWRGHSGPMLHKPLLHVPLVVRLPGQTEGKRIASNAEQVDLLPTVLDLLGMEKPTWADGESLLPMMREGTLSTKPKFAASVYRSPRFVPLNDGTVSVVQGPHKLIRYLASGCEELYDLGTDPRELRNLAAEAPEIAVRLRAEIPAFTGVTVPPGAESPDCKRPWGNQVDDS